MFEGFREFDIDAGETSIHGRVGGQGPALLLLHGFPQTHVMWHATAPRLAEHFTVVAADLRGYGQSGTPRSMGDHAAYSKRAMANDMIAVMAKLGHERFAVAGHDRGGRCAYRMALDHPKSVTRLAVMDLIPTNEAFNRADMRFALGFWPWSFLAQDYPLPERLIAGAPEVIANGPLDKWSDDPECFSAMARAEYEHQFHDADHVHAICEEYRAAATLDYQHDEADKGRRRIACPVLTIWSRQGPIGSWYDPMSIWKEWSDNVTGRAFDCGHFLPEEASEETLETLMAFLAPSGA